MSEQHEQNENNSEDNKFANIWDISYQTIEKNEEHIPKDEGKHADNVNGFIINEDGVIVARFGFFVDAEAEDFITLKVNPDGFMGKCYNDKMNVIMGYGHPVGFTGLVDPSKSQILKLDETMIDEEGLYFRIETDDIFKERGLVFVLRDIDVNPDNLNEEVRDRFRENLESAKEVDLSDLNEIETAHVNYLKHLYVILGEEITSTIPVLEEEVYE